MASILTPDLIASIRRIVGVDAATIPDAFVTDPLIGGAAEQYVLDTVGEPVYLLRPASEQLRIQQAVAFTVAARLLGTRELREASAIESEKFSEQYSVTRRGNAMSVADWQRDLERQAAEALAPLLRFRPKAVFTLAAGRRGA